MKKKHNELKAAIEKGIIDDTKAVGKLWKCSVSGSCPTYFLHGTSDHHKEPGVY